MVSIISGAHCSQFAYLNHYFHGQTTQLDPCLDDSVEFARRCRRLGCDVTLDVLSEVAHGFLNFALVNQCFSVFCTANDKVTN